MLVLAWMLVCMACDDTPDDPCADVDCTEHGTCVVREGEPQCDCHDGFHAEERTCVPEEEGGQNRPSFVGVTSGSGVLESEQHRGFLTVGGQWPNGSSVSEQYSVRVGVGPAAR